MLKPSLIAMFIVLVLLIDASQSSNIFSNSPDYTFYTTLSQATQIKISPNGDKLAIGYNGGSLYIYTTKGSYVDSNYGHYSKIIDIEWDYSGGLVTLDSTGKAILWSNNGNILKKWQFNSTVYDMTVSGYYVAFNFGNKIDEYSLLSYILLRSYFPETNYQFRKIQYSQYRSALYVAYNASYAQVYSVYTGQSQNYYISTYGNIKSFSLKTNSDSVVGLTSNNYLIQISSSGSRMDLGSCTSSSRVSVCPGLNAIALAETYYSSIDIYGYYGLFQQYLSYLPSSATGMDCNSGILVTVDNSGYVTVNSESYFYNYGWVIGLICGLACLLICVVAIICIVKKKKNNQNMNQYNKFDPTMNKAPVPPMYPAQNYPAQNYPKQNYPAQPYFGGMNQGFNNVNTNNYINPSQQQGFNNINNDYFGNKQQNYGINTITNQGNNTNQFNQGNNVNVNYNQVNKGYQNLSNDILIKKEQQSINPYQMNQPKNWN